MLPPTTPIGGAKITSIAHQGFSPVKAAAPSENTLNYSDTGNVPPLAMANAQPTTSNETASADDDGVPAPEVAAPSPPPLIAARAPVMRPAVHADPRFAYAGDDEDRSGYYYKQGYRWAQRAEVQSPRDCRMLAGPQVDGCQAFLRDARAPRDYRRDDDRRDEDDDDRPY